MRINELILEQQQQLDELNLKGLGQGLGKAIGGVAGGAVQGVKNVWSGMKQGYQSGQDALKPDGTPAAPSAPSTGGAPAAPTSTGTAPTGNAPVSNAGTAPNEIGGNNLLARAQQGTTQDPNAPKQPAPQGEQPPAQGQEAPAAPTAQEPAAPAGAAPAAQEPAAPAGPPAMKAAEIVQGLNDIWSKATANQDSQTSSPQVQQQIIAMAKQAALAGRKIENRKHTRPAVVEFHSKFLGMSL
jgi:hypothetical protein